MHELSVCEALLGEASKIAALHDAHRIVSITLRIGPLSGVNADLLARAFEVARAGTLARTAMLQIEAMAVRVECRHCSAQTTAEPGRLLCGSCGEHRVRLIEGDELLLASLELDTREGINVQ
jgi:hydrogenase nickel incorporation protein HypA/HybF